MAEADEMAGRLAILLRGKIAATGTPLALTATGAGLTKISVIPQTARLTQVVDLPRFIPTRLHLGTIIAIFFAILVYIFLWRTTIGFRIRMIGQNIQASRASRINVQKYMVLTFFLSGALVGLGGAIPASFLLLFLSAINFVKFYL